jgi:hypothetical protein
MARVPPPRTPKGERWGGRKKGTPNKVTGDARAAIAAFMDESAPEARKLWQQLAYGDKEAGIKADPARALELLPKLGEFVIPKLARTEVYVPPGEQSPGGSNTTLVLTDEDAMKSYLKMLRG